jgi:predicted Zn-dependent protease
VAYAAKKQVIEARAEQKLFRKEKESLPEGAMFVMNPARQVLEVADSMLEGEILYREAKVNEAISALEEAVRREEQLRYIEPPDWIQPVRHVLGATLMDANRDEDAEKVYRADLLRHPHNGWSLHGLSQSLRAQGKASEGERVSARFHEAWKYADTELTSSCYCLPSRD